ncbi:hypothetical protein Tco_1290664 [Tanacetum coccineum]
MVINPPWNLPFLRAKGLTSPEQTATVKMVFSRPWTCTFLVAKGLIVSSRLLRKLKLKTFEETLSSQVKIKLGEDCWEIYCKRLNTGSITFKPVLLTHNKNYDGEEEEFEDMNGDIDLDSSNHSSDDDA